MYYDEGVDKHFTDEKIEEQCEIKGEEVIALRELVKRQYTALKEIYELKQALVNDKGEYHYILKHYSHILDVMFNLAYDCLGKGPRV